MPPNDQHLDCLTNRDDLREVQRGLLDFLFDCVLIAHIFYFRTEINNNMDSEGPLGRFSKCALEARPSIAMLLAPSRAEFENDAKRLVHGAPLNQRARSCLFFVLSIKITELDRPRPTCRT